MDATPPPAPTVEADPHEAGAPLPARPTAYVFGQVIVGPERRLRAVLGPCESDRCPVAVQLLEGDKLLAAHDLPWTLTRAEPRLGPLDATAGIGDPLALDTRAQGTTLGEEYAAVTIVVQTVRLGTLGEALLLHQVAGYEQVKRSRALFRADSDAIAVAWQRDEPQGPERTIVEVVDVDADGDDEVRVWTLNGPDLLVVDSVRLETFSWSAERRAFEALPAAQAASAVVLRELASEKAARAAQARLPSECREWTLYAPGSFAGAPHAYWLGAVTAHAELAEQARSQWSRCFAQAKPQVKAVSFAGTDPQQH